MNNWRKGIAQWKVGKTLYISIPFTWLMDEAQQIADEHKGDVIMGGPALMEPNDCEGFEPLFHEKEKLEIKLLPVSMGFKITKEKEDFLLLIPLM